MGRRVAKGVMGIQDHQMFFYWETLFAIVYGTEVVIPTEIGLPTLQSDIVDMPVVNQNQLLLNLDLAEETR